MDGLIHQRTATIKGPCAAPASGIVVGLITVPLDVGGGTGENAEATFVRGFFEGIHARVEAAIENGGEGLAIGGCSVYELVDALGGDFQRFLDDGVLARLESCQGGVEVGSTRGPHGHNLELRVSEKGIDV